MCCGQVGLGPGRRHVRVYTVNFSPFEETALGFGTRTGRFNSFIRVCRSNCQTDLRFQCVGQPWTTDAGVRRNEDISNLKQVRQEDVILLGDSGPTTAITAILEAVGELSLQRLQ